jgi:hypothetical protein
MKEDRYALTPGAYCEGVKAMYEQERINTLRNYPPGPERKLTMFSLNVSEPLLLRAALGLDQGEAKAEIVEDCCRALSSALCSIVDLLANSDIEDREEFMTERIEAITKSMRDAAVHSIRQVSRARR